MFWELSLVAAARPARPAPVTITPVFWVVSMHWAMSLKGRCFLEDE
ncbi:hypothetical protein NC652_038003 [Populus alba x Populus x berolinensis]|nr:hypothetical protein NC652_038003 [Populus alba x Populus x berolinensis]